MAAPGAAQLGVTSPLSLALPTDAELQASAALVDELKRQNNYENPEITNKRSAILTHLQNITEEFIRQVSKAQGLADSVVKTKGGKIATFGSFKLGVIGPGSDIDTLVVAPANISADDFFSKFPEILQKKSPEGAVTELTCKPDAHAPIITLKYQGVDLDLIFGRIAVLNQIPKDLSMTSADLLRGLSDKEVRSLNGIRVADEMLSLVPEQGVFRTALRAIKLWSSRRAIAGNIYGFPGGVAWAILVARVCQLYPKATASIVVLKFFRILEKWQWPMPVVLNQIDYSSKYGNYKVWNPKIYGGDRNHLMPIITPAYPSMCTTHNVSRSTMHVILNELKRGGDIMEQIMSGQKPWKELFTKHTFFTAGYKYYLSVITASTSEEAHLPWSGWVESRIRQLITGAPPLYLGLEGHESLALVHPFNKGYGRVHRCRNQDEVEKAKAGSLEYQAKDIATSTTGHGLAAGTLLKTDLETPEENPETDANVTMVYTTTHYLGLEMYPGAKSLDLSAQVKAFKAFVIDSDNYDHESNALNIIHIRNSDLPDDLFEEGEVKPTRPQKKKAVNGTSKKRVASDESNQGPPAKRQQTSVVAAG